MNFGSIDKETLWRVDGPTGRALPQDEAAQRPSGRVVVTVLEHCNERFAHLALGKLNTAYKERVVRMLLQELDPSH